MLHRSLEFHGENVANDRVSAWLSTCATAAERRKSRPPESLMGIRGWLEGHPGVQKQVILAGLGACEDGDNVGRAAFKNRKRLLGAKLPIDFGRWCLEQAVRLASTEPRVAKHLLLEACRALETPGLREGLSLEVLQEQTQGHALLEEVLTRLQTPIPVPQDEEPWRQEQAAYVAEQERERQQLLRLVRLHESRLLENRAHPELLYQLALVYFGEVPSLTTGLRGAGAIAQALGDPAAVAAAMHGLRHSFDRTDLPSVTEIIRLAGHNREHYISLPLLAGLEELEEAALGLPLAPDQEKLRTCVACLHCWEPHFLELEDTNPGWYQAVIDHRPDIVSDVAVQCAAGALRKNGTIPARFWQMVESRKFEPATRSALPALLRTLPTRCNARQIEALDALLWTGIQSDWRSDLVDLARKRLSKTGMDVGQRVRWLGLGLIYDPQAYRERLAEALSDKEPQNRHLARFFVHGDRSPLNAEVWTSVLEALEPSDLALIIRQIGRFFAPIEPVGFTYVSDELRVSWFLDHVINNLGSRPSSEAGASLDSLLADPELSSWHGLLSAVRTTQHALRRDAEFLHPTLQRACETLLRGGPANVCDLAALTVDTIDVIARRIRTSNANEWRQYWNEGPHGIPSRPRVEEACRDAFLTALRPLLPPSVRAEPEGQQVNRNRADLAITAGDFEIPVEAKKNSHRDLWSAIDNQLVAKYTLDPATGGYGIYLVFWFGVEHQRQRADGARPTRPQELQRLLRSSLSEDQACRIHVRVVDVCRPGPPP